MGVSNSKLDDDKALKLCRERKRLVRQALDGRCSLAAAHLLYIQSLRSTGTALRKSFDPEAPIESSLYTSTSATPEPLALTEKSLSQFSYSSPSVSQRVDPTEALSPPPSPPGSSRFHASYMTARGTSSTTIEERPPVSLTAKVKSSFGANTSYKSDLPTEVQSLDTAPSPHTPPWDYFRLFDKVENPFSFQEGRRSNQGLEDDEIKRLREEEDIPDLEEVGEKGNLTPRSEDYTGSEDDFDDPSSVPLVQSFERRADILDSFSPTSSSRTPSKGNISRKVKRLSEDKVAPKDDMDEADEREMPDMTPLKKMHNTLPIEEKREQWKEQNPGNKPAAKDFLSSIREIEYLFVKASEAGEVVPRMLEASNLQLRPLFAETKARRSMASKLVSTCLSCMEAPEEVPQELPPNGVKYLTWHRSTSSRSSSSRNPLGSSSKDGMLDSSAGLFNSFCMNSGSHASTLDRLYAWERKLYDEVKASGVIRREYDMKCKLLRYQDSQGESPIKIDKTRAAVKDLHSRIRVAIQRIDSISKIIEDLRDTELQPQLEELIEGLKRMWEMMLEKHKLQYDIISIAYNNGPTKLSLQSDSHRQGIVVLESELNSLCVNFTKWISAQQSYLHAINGWLRKSVAQQKSRSKKPVEFCPRRALGPPIFVLCKDWLEKIGQLPTSEVVDGIKGLLTVATVFLPRQEKTHKKNLTSSFSWKAERDTETASDLRRNEAPVDWNLTFENLHSSLVVFFEGLNNFSSDSVKMYTELKLAVEQHQKFYREADTRMQK